MASYLLASFCNLPVSTFSPVLLIKTQPDEQPSIEFSPISLGYPRYVTATGMARKDGKIYVMFTSEGKNCVSALREGEFNNIFNQELPEVLDAHSIHATDQHLYIVSTGTDQVLRYDLNATGLEHPSVFWEASSAHKDTHHINSIVEMDGDLYISAFGPRTGELWASATQGYIHNISRDQQVARGIYHPHSLTTRRRQLFYCDSHHGTFCSLQGPLFYLDGYSRGIVWLSDERVAVTTSIGRKVSKSTGKFMNPADPGEKAGTCSLSIKEISTGNTILASDLSWFGPEIYDLLLLDQPVDLLKTTADAFLAERRGLDQEVKSRSNLTAQSFVNQQSIQTLSSQLREHQQIIQNLSAQLGEIERSKAWIFSLWIRRIRVRLAPPNSKRGQILHYLYLPFRKLFSWIKPS
ncbi:MAG: DUF4915 domain-containing protein [Anaerolineaceae bacterium]|nr:DUF4915 domain-containing protein [Anaerolineaceae bacterium]